jgi:hypothetical protein
VTFSTHQNNNLVITFDDEKTGISHIQKALRKGGITPVGKPVYLEQGAQTFDANAPPSGADQTHKARTGS